MQQQPSDTNSILQQYNTIAVLSISTQYLHKSDRYHVMSFASCMSREMC